MSATTQPRPFDAQHAANYDDRWAPLAPLRDSLHLQMRFILQELPAAARVLCVGVGTGAELLALARFFPGWRFTAVEPAAPMLEVCCRKAAEAGIAERCVFHAGYLHELPPTEPFDAATTILVSQFITDRPGRTDFFRAIARRLRPDGLLLTADLTTAPAGQHESLLGVWSQMMRHIGAGEAQIEAMLASYGREVALLPAAEMEELLTEAGFVRPVRFSQSLLMQAWFARLASGFPSCA
ncbi:class I SAM-dependent methyltransferase [Oleiharenicola lentus]|uniref:Class I SAM-dependent methyltransferase n=1 Tax=Oleiharenicola lentus TaxID=2508720 RepID=A0A4Q1C5G3_9BACT|nr:class I SAM-dependent methyltransferase [Oleiharenicola lentus]RXK53680.1 class I SAM-dependent methyltransferase [Oleiharenicola lentus]